MFECDMPVNLIDWENLFVGLDFCFDIRMVVTKLGVSNTTDLYQDFSLLLMV